MDRFPCPYTQDICVRGTCGAATCSMELDFQEQIELLEDRVQFQEAERDRLVEAGDQLAAALRARWCWSMRTIDGDALGPVALALWNEAKA